MTATKINRLTLLLLFASSILAQEANGYGVTQGINCFGKEYVCVGPLNYKHCEWDPQGNTYAAGNVIQCPSNHRCVNDGVEICTPLKLSTTAPQAEPLISSEVMPVNSISTENPIKKISVNRELTSTMPDTTTDMVVNKETSSILVATTTSADGSIWTTFLTENPNVYNILGLQSSDANFHLTTSSPLEPTTNAILETTKFQYGTTTTSDTYTTLTQIISDDSSLPVKSNNLLETGSKVDVTHISLDKISLKKPTSETTSVRNISSDINFPEDYYSTISTSVPSTGNETKAPIDAHLTISSEGSSGSSPFNQQLETTTLIYSTLTNPSLPVEHNPLVNPKIPIDISSSTNPNTATIPVDETNTIIPSTSSHPDRSTSSSISLEHNSPNDPNNPIEFSSPTDPSATSTSTDPNSTIIPVDQNITVVPNPSFDPSTLAHPSLSVGHNSLVDPNIPIELSSSANEFISSIPVDQTNPINSIVSSDSSTLASLSLPADLNLPVNTNNPIELSTSTDPNTTTIPVDQTTIVITSASSDHSTLAHPSLSVEHIPPADPNIPIELSSSANEFISSIPVDQINASVSSDSSTLASLNLPVNTNNPIELSTSTDPNTTTIPVDQTNIDITSPSFDPSTLANHSLSVEHNETINSVDQINAITPSTLSSPSIQFTSSFPVKNSSPNGILIETKASTDANIVVSPNLSLDYNTPVDPNNPNDAMTSSDPSISASSLLPVKLNSETKTKIPVEINSQSVSNTANIPVDKSYTIIPSVSSDPSTPASSNLPVEQNSPADPKIAIDLSSPADQTNTIIPSVSSDLRTNLPLDYNAPMDQTSPNDPNTSSHRSASTSSRLSVKQTFPVDPNTLIELSASTNHSAVNVMGNKNNPIIPSPSSEPHVPAVSSLPINPNKAIELSAAAHHKIASSTVHQPNQIILNSSSDPNSITSSSTPLNPTIPIVLNAATNSAASSSLSVNSAVPNPELNASIDYNTTNTLINSSAVSDPTPTITRIPVKSNPSPIAVNLDSLVALNNPMDSSTSAVSSSPANTIMQFDSNVPVLRSEPFSKNQLSEDKALVTSNSPAATKVPTSHIASTYLNYVRPRSSIVFSSTVNANTPLAPNMIIGSKPNTPVDHTSPLNSSVVHTGLTKWYLYSRNKGANTNNETNNGLMLLPKQSRQPTSSKKPILQENIETESSEVNSSKSILKDDDSIEEKSKSNSKKSRRQMNSRNNKRKEEIIERESSEISLPEKRQNKDTSMENKSGANSKESKDSKDFQKENVEVERNLDDENDESTSSEQKELIKKILKKIKDTQCDEDDIYPDHKDCKKYYRCVKKNHKTKVSHLRCESGDRFDSDKLKCVDKRKAKCFSKEDFIEEFA